MQPSQPPVIDTYGWALLHYGNKNRALVLLQQATVQAPHMHEIRYHMAVALEKNGCHNEALQESQWLFNEKADFPGMDGAKVLLDRLKK